MFRMTRAAVRTSRRLFAIREVPLSQLGEGLKEAEIKEWFGPEGRFLREGEPMVRVEADKGSVNIMMPEDGTVVRQLHRPGAFCKIGEPLVVIDTKAEAADTPASTPSGAPQSPVQAPQPAEHGVRSTIGAEDRALASPPVRKLAKETGVDLAKVTGSGPKGRVLKEDVAAFAAAQRKGAQPPAPGFHEGAQKVEMTIFQRAMVKTMTQAASVPLFNLHERYDVTRLVELRDHINLTRDKQERISMLAFFVKTLSLAMHEHPRINSLYYPERDPHTFFTHREHNVTIAVDTPHGLVVPNIKNVQDLGVAQIAREIRRLRDLAYAKSLTPAENDHGTVCITNIGSITGTFAAPLPMPHQCLIVATGAVDVLPVWDREKQAFAPRSVLHVSFSADHRVLDGGSVARFSLAWKQLLENPSAMFLKMK